MVPFAAQSREEPVPYSFPAMMISGVLPARYVSLASKNEVGGASGAMRVHHPSIPGVNSFLSRMLANVPRIITS